ncbi:radical SAM protein [Magnetovibrio sp.]|uniref:B12-binding domain-containing radical SAM protein n=1 Tax=Magnetovibrio sp. TaxID=2024836 RepID=UPI002F92A55C
MNSTRRALLLNPPGRETYIRDYYCSKLSRTGYTFPPVDLLHAGAQFKRAGWTVQAIDAIVQNLGIAETLTAAKAAAPDAVFTLVGAVSVDEDAEFLNALRVELPRAIMIGSGDVLREHGRQWIESGLLDAVALDFSAASPVRFASGETEDLVDLIYKTAHGIEQGPDDTGNAKNYSVGLPPHELFKPLPYRFPFAARTPFASVLTDYGCPYRCSFCVMSQLHYHARPIEEVAAEFEHLRALGIREFALWDQTFAISRPRATAFLDVLPGGRDRFGWTCFTRPDCIDAELAKAMAAKGCHTVIMGVETAKPETLQAIQKDFATPEMKAAFTACRNAGLETVATVIVGLPGETADDIEATMDFVCHLDPDYLSVHTAIPRAGTKLRRQMVEQGLVSEELANMDQSGETSVLSSDTLSPQEILRLRKRFNRRFYLRPGFLLRTVWRNLINPRRLIEHVRQGLSLLSKNA